MKNIKFRAWDKNKKEMLESNDNGTCKVSPEVYDSAFIFIGLNGEVMKYERERTRGATFFDAGIQGQHEIDGTNEKFILMQFTGLKDKNGKEIYEGDVLEGFRAREVVEFSTEPESDCDEGGYFYGYHFYKINPSQSEVIGNIYEDKELLK